MHASALKSHRDLLTLLCVAGYILLWGIEPARAQWVRQEIDLQPGWNAIFLEVTPAPSDCATVFQGIPVESAWLWNSKMASSQFVENPANLNPKSPEWLVYHPNAGTAGFDSTLNTVLGGRAYLIKLLGDQSVRWSVIGIPQLKSPKWIPNAYNFVGFHLADSNLPTFARFFAPSRAQAGQAVYELKAGGTWELVNNPGVRTMQRGRAYWVFSTQASTYNGPIELEFGLGPELDFGTAQSEAVLGVRNLLNGGVSVTFAVRESLPPPVGTSVLAGTVPLARFVLDLQKKSSSYVPISGSLALSLGAGESDRLRLALRRRELAAFNPPANGTPALYQALLEVNNGAGVRMFIPVRCAGGRPLVPAAAGFGLQSLAANISSPPPYAGLWVGLVTVNGVNEPRGATPTRSQPTPTEFNFRVLIHVDARGTCRLLSEALIMFRAGTTMVTPENPEFVQTDAPGQYVVLSDSRLVNARDADGNLLFRGATIRDNTVVGRRLSSANFSFQGIHALAGRFNDPGAGLQSEADLVVGWKDPVNPFLHLYHPDHDNKDREFHPLGQDQGEAWEVKRHLKFQFITDDPGLVSSPGYGTDVVGGAYEERIVGLHREPLVVQGSFTLSRLLPTPELNGGMDNLDP